MPAVPPPPASMSAWQWLILFAIVSSVTVLQSYFLHRKMNDAASSKTPPKDSDPS